MSTAQELRVLSFYSPLPNCTSYLPHTLTRTSKVCKAAVGQRHSFKAQLSPRNIPSASSLPNMNRVSALTLQRV